MWVERTRETQARDFNSGMPFESITLTTIAGRSNLYSNILEEAKETALKAHEGKYTNVSLFFYFLYRPSKKSI